MYSMRQAALSSTPSTQNPTRSTDASSSSDASIEISLEIGLAMLAHRCSPFPSRHPIIPTPLPDGFHGFLLGVVEPSANLLATCSSLFATVVPFHPLSQPSPPSSHVVLKQVSLSPAPTCWPPDYEKLPSGYQHEYPRASLCLIPIAFSRWPWLCSECQVSLSPASRRWPPEYERLSFGYHPECLPSSSQPPPPNGLGRCLSGVVEPSTDLLAT
ncbi:hypothetical protein JAAARDRAFT_190112 [Jaapia argillacea MUCL 33604]|uniref:Uncharacterized protein n=1 Tax=Jaapia argillacea MUCL 33604 TaxID=933084 RepID=A0A067QCT7_9AGAM|nr:hypothetical protein JAAARDRAFT_190112 [Jaapia argillacea MUCL 33604]